MGRQLVTHYGYGESRQSIDDKHSKYMKKYFLFITVIALLAACKGNKSNVTENDAEAVGTLFNADSAYAFCAAQCAFGPRTMNSTAHEDCAQWIISQFTQYGAEVSTQKADITAWDGNKLHSTNIIARINPEAQERIIICAHWDSRPWADNDSDPANHKTPVMAANDGASGVAVMLELARTLQTDTAEARPKYGIDFVCFDAEDYGVPQWHDSYGNAGNERTWALGAQFFAMKYQETANVKYTCGILLDMVGGQGAKFYQEGFSIRHAKGIVDEVWQAAETAGYSSYFPTEQSGFITDDHGPLNSVGIPTIDIIPYYPDCRESSFGPTWHTVNDNMNNIDKSTLQAVGQTMIQYLYTR